MGIDLEDIRVFTAVAKAGGFREASRVSGTSASSASEAVRRLEGELGVRLLHRTTRSVAPTEEGARLLARLDPALLEIASALDVVKASHDRPAGTLRLNVPTVAARVVLPRILPPFLAAYPDVRVEVTADDALVDILAAGCDAGIRYEETLERDMIAVPIGPREQRFALGGSPTYLERNRRPTHPKQLLEHACLRMRFAGRTPLAWVFERKRETVRVETDGPLVGNIGNAVDLLIAAAVGGSGLVYTFEEWLAPHFDSGALEPLLELWWLRFPGPFLYYPSRRHMPAPLRAFVDFVKKKR